MEEADVNKLSTLSKYSKTYGIALPKLKTIIDLADLKSYGVSNYGGYLYKCGDISNAIEDYDSREETVDRRGEVSISSLERKRELECERIQLDLDTKRGKFVSLEEVQNELYNFVALIQQRLLVIYPRSIPHKLQNKNPREMQAILAQEGKAFLNELSASARTIIGNDTTSDNSDGEQSIRLA